MKKVLISLINYKKNKINDEFYTPSYAVYPLLEYIPKDKIIWCPFDFEESEFVKIFKNRGNKVIYSHIIDDKNFFEYEPEEYDIIVSNPPYSIKDYVLERCFKLGKPFALLLPITALEGKKRGILFRKYGIELLVFDKRIEFQYKNKNNKNGVWFNTGYFCYKILPQQLIFKELDKTLVNKKEVNNENIIEMF